MPSFELKFNKIPISHLEAENPFGLVFPSIKKKKIFFAFILCIFSADPIIVLKNFKMFVLTTKSWKNHPQKFLRIPQIHFFSPTALTAQKAQTEEFLFQNVAYWLTV